MPGKTLSGAVVAGGLLAALRGLAARYEQDVAAAIHEINLRGPRIVALSSHDSTPWTYDAFGAAFGEQYGTLRVGDELVISAGGAALRPSVRQSSS